MVGLTSSFARTDEQVLLESNLARMLRESPSLPEGSEGAPDRLRTLWSSLGDLGYVAAAFPESAAGCAGDARTIAAICGELGRSLSNLPYTTAAVCPGALLSSSNAGPLGGSLGREVIEGSRICVFAHDAGADPYGVPSAAATHAGPDVIVDGTVRCVRGAHIADSFLVTVALGASPIVVHVPRSDVELESYRLMDGSRAADLHLRGVSASAQAIICAGEEARRAIDAAIDAALRSLAAEVVGIADALCADTFAYLQARRQFGVPIASFQALQHRAADMLIAREELTALVDLALQAADASGGKTASRLASAAKSHADTLGRRVGHEAAQLHGAMGVSGELRIGHFVRRLATIRAEFGASDLHRRRFGRM